MPLVVIIPVLIIRIFAGKRSAARAVRTLIRIYGFIIVRVLTFPFVRVERVRKESGDLRRGCVYVCNHRASSDAFLMESLNHELIQVVNNWPFKIPVLGWIARVAGYLSIRSMPFELFLKESCKRLQEGVSVVAFPEGSRSADSTVHQFNGAVFRVAQQAGVPIVPVCLSGNQDIPPKGSGLLNPGVIKIHILPALEWETFKDMSPFKLKNHVRQILQNEIDRLEGN